MPWVLEAAQVGTVAAAPATIEAPLSQWKPPQQEGAWHAEHCVLTAGTAASIGLIWELSWGGEGADWLTQQGAAAPRALPVAQPASKWVSCQQGSDLPVFFTKKPKEGKAQGRRKDTRS